MVLFARIEKVSNEWKCGWRTKDLFPSQKRGAIVEIIVFQKPLRVHSLHQNPSKFNTPPKTNGWILPNILAMFEGGDTLKETSFLVSVFTLGGVNLWIRVKTFKTAFLASTWIPPNATIAMKSLLWRCGRPLLPWRRGMPRRRGMSTGTLALLSSKKSG